MTQPGSLIIGLPGTELSKQDKAWINHPAVAGIILFSHNIQNKAQITAFNDSIRETRDEIFICVDQEGGRVQRFREGFSEIPPMGTLGKTFEKDPELAIKTAFEYGETIAKELLEVGVDFTFAPVLDLDFGHSSVIGNRAFHSDPEIVAKLAASFIEGLHEHDMAVCGKHFPGHGFVTPDSHVADPVDTRTLEELMEQDLLPYKILVDELDCLMTAHILFPEVDNEIVSYSPFWLKTILRQELGYEGLIISDDLVMHAAAKMAPIERVSKALAAGCDMVLYCQDYAGISEILGL